MLDVLLIWAQGATKPAANPAEMWTMPVFLMVMLGLFWFIVLRPQQKRQEQERLRLLGSLEKNNKVLTVSGIYGTVVSVSDKEDEVVVKVDDSTRLRMTKQSILRNLTHEENLKAQKDSQKKEGAA